MQTISIIVPCCNEAAALPLFYDEATRVLSSMPVDYELLFVDDGSRDGTLAEMRRLAAADAHVKYVSFSRNFGKEAAMYAGFCNARGDYAAVMDCDLQHPPALLPQMYELLQEGDCDSVAMRRQDRAGEPVVRSWFAHRFYRLINRIFLGPIFMLTIAAGILLTDAIAGAEGRTLRCLLVAFCLLGLVSLGSEAKRGVADYHQAWQAAVQTIEAERARGHLDVTIDPLFPPNRFCAAYDLGRIAPREKNHAGLNRSIAGHFGLRTIQTVRAADVPAQQP